MCALISSPSRAILLETRRIQTARSPHTPLCRIRALKRRQRRAFGGFSHAGVRVNPRTRVR